MIISRTSYSITPGIVYFGGLSTILNLSEGNVVISPNELNSVSSSIGSVTLKLNAHGLCFLRVLKLKFFTGLLLPDRSST